MRLRKVHNPLFFIFFAFLAACPFFALAESVRSFVEDIYPDADGSIAITETITYDFGVDDRHGIFRDILDTHPQESSSLWKRRFIDIAVTGVKQDGAEIPYEVSRSGDATHIKIGDPDHTITGEHTYTIDYRADGAYSFFDDDTAELYWNATGNSWEVPIAMTQATIHSGSVPLLPDRACYQGAYGENGSCSIEEREDGSIVFTAQDLAAGEGLTIAAAIDGTAVAHVMRVRYNWVPFIAGAAFAALFVLIIFGIRYRMRYRSNRPVIAQYEPYGSFKPMYSGVILDGRLDPRDITAGIVYLAQQGFLKIHAIEKEVMLVFHATDYEVELLRPSSEIESSFLRQVVGLLLPDGNIGDRIALSSLKKDTSQMQQNYKTMTSLQQELKSEMKKDGLFEVNANIARPMSSLIAIGVIGVIIITTLGDLLPAALIMAGVGGGILCVVAFLFFYERRTASGFEAQNHLKGFKLFLEATEKERYAFHNAPQKSPEQFMEFLPYAIAFGVEKQWADAFKDITIPAPGWYEGNNAAFSAVNLSSSLGTFSSSFAASSGSSGSGGGGFSGGGGGGGGGGSW
jgi:uncharacterized membrane protein YgcG